MPAIPAFRSVPAGRGVNWLLEGFGQFRQAPAVWIVMSLLWLVVGLLVNLIPLVGAIALNLTLPIVVGGIVLGAHAQREHRGPRISNLWAGFAAPHLQPLLLLGMAYIVFALLQIVAAAGLLYASAGSVFITGQMEFPRLDVGSLLGLLSALLVFLVFSLATLFAPALIVLHGLPLLEALKLSLRAGLANLGALSVYSLLSLLMVVIASIPLGLGLLVALPVLLISVYCAYRDIFTVNPVSVAR